MAVETGIRDDVAAANGKEASSKNTCLDIYYTLLGSGIVLDVAFVTKSKTKEYTLRYFQL